MAKKGGGGSQLAQLKSRLRNEGVTDRRQMKASAKKRKRGQAGSERDDAQARRDRLDAITSSSSFNPFEEKVTKPKNAVLGRHVRGATGKPGVAKMGGMRERTERLLPEWSNRNKSGAFVDRRFGEQDGHASGSASHEDKMIERFTREQEQRQTAGARSGGKISLFDLDDGEEDGLEHFGQSLNDLDEDDLQLQDADMADDRGTNPFRSLDNDDKDAEGDDDDRKKSKAEVMKEIIAKSKLYKHERQQSKMADEDLRQELDDELGDIRSLLLDQGKATDQQSQQTETVVDLPLFGNRDFKKDAYDSAVRELAFERRAKPQDRLKTEEEKAEELATQLRNAEERRLKRMRGEESNEDETDQRSKRNRRPAGGDDLEDDFELDGMTAQDVYGLGQGLERNGDVVSDDQGEDAIRSDDEVAEQDEADIDGRAKDTSEDEESSDEELIDDIADLDALEQPGEVAGSDFGEEENLISERTRQQKSEKQSESIPFTFQCPETLDDLLHTLESSNIKEASVPTVVKRIRALHHPSLAEANQYKLRALNGVLIDYILHISSALTAENFSVKMQVVNALIPQIFTLTRAYPVSAAEHFVEKLGLMQRNLGRGLSRGAQTLEARTWPGAAECILLKITGTIWPTSDRTHSVTTPLILLITQYLSSCRIRNIQDIAKGLFLCSLVASNERQSARIVPEALNFLHNVITVLGPVSSRKGLAQLNQQFGIPWPDFGLETTRGLCLDPNTQAKAAKRIHFLNFVSPGAEIDEVSFKSTLLSTALNLVDEFRRLYMGSTAFVELMLPFQVLLDIHIESLPPLLEAKRRATLDLVTRAVKNAVKQRRALRLQAHRAIPLASHIPKFDQGFDPTRKGGKAFDPDADRAEQAKLRALLKKERKGAVRELRRDNEFLAEARRKAREEEDQRYGKAIDKIMGSLSAERGEEKSYLKEKQKIKRRAGKK